MPALLENLSGKIQTAKDSGYKENEILDYLGQDITPEQEAFAENIKMRLNLFDKIQTARNSGYKDTEILDYLSKTKTQVATSTVSRGTSAVLEERPENNFKSMVEQIEKLAVDLSGLPGSDIARKTQELGTEMLLGVGGAVLGTAVAPGMGTLVGAGAGYALGKRLNEIARGEEKDIGKSFIDAAKDMAWGATFEGAGQLAGKGIEKITGLYKGRVNKQFVKQAKELGVRPTPDDITKSKTLAQFETNLRRFYGSGQLFYKEDIENTQKLIEQYKNAIASGKGATTVEELGNAIKSNVDDYVTRIESLRGRFLNQARNTILKDLGSPDTYETLGSKFHEATKEESQALGKIVKDRYEEVKGMINSAIPQEQHNIPLIETKKVAEKYIKELSTTPVLANKYKGIINDLEDILSADKMDWESTELTRRLYRDTAVKVDEAFQATTPGIKGQIKEGKSLESLVYSRLKNAIQSDQTAYTELLGNDIQSKYEIAKKTAQTLKTTYGNPEIIKLVQSHPGEVIDEILKPTGYAEIEAVKKAIGQSNFDKIIKPGITNKILGIGKDEIFDPAYTQNQLSRLNKQLLEKIYNPNELKIIADIAKKGIDFANKPLYPAFLKQIAESGKESAYGIAKQAFAQDGKYLTRNLSTIYKLSDQATKDELKYQMTVQLFTGKQPSAAIDPMSIGAREPKLLGFSGKAFRKQLDKFYPLLKQFGYSTDDIGLLKKIANVAENLKGAERVAGNPSGTGQAMATQAQLGVALSLIFSGHPIGAAAVAGAPYILAKAYLSTTGRRLLTEGLKIPYGTPQATEWLTKMMTYSAARNTGENNQ